MIYLSVLRLIFSVFITPGIGVALQSRLAPFVASADLQTDIQARFVRILSVPEYYPEYRDTGNGFAGFLGASIAAKVCSSTHLSCVVLKPRSDRI